MPDRAKYSKITDLYTEGTELVLDNGLVIYMKALNPYELEEARHAAQTARSRVVLSLRNNGEEQQKLDAKFEVDGRESVIEQVVEAEANEKLLEIIEDLQNDEEWEERLDILEREDDTMSIPDTDADAEYIEQINQEYMDEVNDRLEAEREYLTQKYEKLSDDQLREKYRELWIDRRGGEIAMTEYRLNEHYFAARACDGEQDENGDWDHGKCDGHKIQVWEEKKEVRDLPGQLHELMAEKMSELNMIPREAKSSGSQASSSDSSGLPKQQEESTASTQEEAPVSAPGT